MRESQHRQVILINNNTRSNITVALGDTVVQKKDEKVVSG